MFKETSGLVGWIQVRQGASMKDHVLQSDKVVLELLNFRASRCFSTAAGESSMLLFY